MASKPLVSLLRGRRPALVRTREDSASPPAPKGPAEPHRAFGGYIDETISCGGISVSPADLVIGDADGVTIVSRDRMSETLEAIQLLKEQGNLAKSMIEKGEGIETLYGVPSITERPD